MPMSYRDGHLNKAYAEGAAHSGGGGLVTDDPFDAAGPNPQLPESTAWVLGFNDHAAGTADFSDAGYPAATLPPPEIVNEPRW